jgi:phosphoglycerate dehydrogenase-like enzyme
MDVLVAIFSDTEAWTMPAAYVEELRRRFPGIGFLHAGNDEAMERLIPTADVAFTSRLTPRAFGAARALRWVHSPAAGVHVRQAPPRRRASGPRRNPRSSSARRAR